MKTVKYIVTGKVQGVWFRASTKQRADALGVTGSAINLPTGQVEVLATGDNEQHIQLKIFLDQGPELAEVDDVQASIVELKTFEGFVTG